jgi:hypothetical protein
MVVKDLDLSGVTRVYPLLITLDEIGGCLLMSRHLNHYFSEYLNRSEFEGLEIKPLFCTDVESVEEIAGCFQRMSLAGFLDHWLEKDPNLMATLMAFTVPELVGHRNAYMFREWHALSGEISARLFPEDYAAAQASGAHTT